MLDYGASDDEFVGGRLLNEEGQGGLLCQRSEKGSLAFWRMV